MLWKTFFSVFVTIFLAEIGDKTQLATMLFSSDVNAKKWVVFLGTPWNRLYWDWDLDTTKGYS